MWAALEGFPRRVALLLDAGVDPDGQGTRHPILKGRTALEVALLEGHTEVALALHAGGAREPELERAQRVEAAYMAADPAVSDPPPPGLIARAAAQGNAAAVALLLERGADVNALRASAPPPCTRPPGATTPQLVDATPAAPAPTARCATASSAARPRTGRRTPATPSWPNGSPRNPRASRGSQHPIGHVAGRTVRRATVAVPSG